MYNICYIIINVQDRSTVFLSAGVFIFLESISDAKIIIKINFIYQLIIFIIKIQLIYVLSSIYLLCVNNVKFNKI